MILAVVAGAVVVIGVMFAFVAIRVKGSTSRYLTLETWAEARGWTFTGTDFSLPSRFGTTPARFAIQGFAQNVIEGAAGGAPVVLFDCMIDVNAGGGRMCFVAVGLPADVPFVEVGRESRRDRLVRDLGFRDIEFENETFNRLFTVRGPVPAFAYDVLNPRMIEWLLASDGPDWQLVNRTLVCWHPGALTIPIVEADLAYAEGVMANIPRFVWEKASGV